MAIYRGAGGAGDATGDSASEALLVREISIEVQANADAAEAAKVAALAAQAASEASEIDAETAASNAATSASNAASSASSASSSASTATTQAGIATTQATNASNSATAAASSASSASTSATNAASSATSSATSATNANNSANAASTSATNAANSATSAATSATTATTQATNASNSATAASTSATNASSSATSASTSASTATTQAGIATTQATNAANSASAAATSATNASNSASAAATSATNASNSASAAATSASNAATSASNAATSETNAGNFADDASDFADDAALSATNASTSATEAAASAAVATAAVFSPEAVRHSVRPSLLLDFANTKTLDPRITFTRASTASFYDGKTVAKAEENLVLYSQEFDNAYWSKPSTTVLANNTSAPDGTTTAELLYPTTTGTFRGVNRTDASTAAVVTSTNTKVISFFAKAFNKSWVYSYDPVPGTQRCFFDVTNGVVGTVAAGHTATITSVGNGWYRCVVITSTAYSASSGVGFGIADSNNTTTATTNSTDGIYLWGAQLEQRSSVTAYTATTTAPITNYIPALQTAASGVARFEHNPVTGESLGLEIEEQRTNLLTYSEQFDNASWAKTNATVSANTIIAPDGTLTGDKLIADTVLAQHRVQLTPTSSAGNQTLSVYAKAGEYGYAYIRIGTTGALFNLATGAYVSSLGTPVSYSSTSVGNGWYRLVVTVNALANDIARINVQNDATQNDFAGNGFSGIYIWGAQLEAGSFATSYIPTAASQVTRSADSASMTGTNFSSWYRANEGTVYTEFASAATGTNLNVVQLGSTSLNVISLHRDGGSTNWRYRTSLSNLNLNGAQFVATGTKVGFAYATSDYPAVVNGNSAQLNTGVGTVSAADQLYIGAGNQYAAAAPLNGTMRKLAYYPKRLTNAELQGLTTV